MCIRDRINPVEKQDTSLALATENQMFFLDPETTEFSPAVECGPYMEDDIAQMCGESYDVLTVSINSPDDAIDFGRNMHMATPVSYTHLSANPTGPMHIGNARGGALGDSLSSVLQFAGYEVEREFYVNDAGNQIDCLLYTSRCV